MEITPNYVVSVNDARSYVSAALAGMGVVQSPRFMVAEALRKGELVRILPDWSGESIPLYIVYPQTRHLSNKVRVFVDWLAKLIQSHRPRGCESGKSPSQTTRTRSDSVSRNLRKTLPRLDSPSACARTVRNAALRREGGVSRWSISLRSLSLR